MERFDRIMQAILPSTVVALTILTLLAILAAHG